MARITGTKRSETLNGSNANDEIFGLEGNDTLSGLGGTDSLYGGLGNDIYVVDNAGDKVIEKANEGTDLVQASVSYTLANNVENLTLTGTKAINATGNSVANILIGNVGNNVLDGKAGADKMNGGKGNDTYIIDNIGDVVTEKAGEGTDTVQSSISFTLASNFENLTLTGTKAINATGNSVANILIGNVGNNVLDGKAGADKMAGGAGNDTYVVDNIGDVVTEKAGEGTDLVQASISYTLANNVENLTLTGAGDINATGNGASNILTGNDGNNILDGKAGADTMIGGLGDDIFVVDNVGDVLIEKISEGLNTVKASIDYVLGDYFFNLVLTGALNINGSGNEYNNRLTGNAGANLLDGGWGGDTMAGGAGDDTYVIEDFGDDISEAADEGYDSVQSSVTYTLTDNIEKLTLTGDQAINGAGNSLDNYLVGNNANNTINGGVGGDAMVGLAGDDTYFVDSASDTVTEEASGGTDRVLSSESITLSANVENLAFLGNGSASGTGNALDNTILGNGGDNMLDGGLGADTLIGSSGYDTFVVDNVGDVTTEEAGLDTDQVMASITWTLSANIENLTLTGSEDIDGTGNGLNNVITGNNGNNVLTGGTGNDTLSGGSGDDQFQFATEEGVSVANFGADTIYEFVAGSGDVLKVGTQFQSLADLLNDNRIVDDGQGNCKITFDIAGTTTSTIKLVDVLTSELTEGDFLFS